MADGGGHAAHLTVLAFNQLQADPAIGNAFAELLAPTIRTGGSRRQVGLARRVTGTKADAGKGALVFGFPLESAARRLAASLRQV